MAPDEQEGAANQVEPPETEKPVEKESPKLKDLGEYEKVVNEYALKFAKKHRVKESDFVIVLVNEIRGGGVWAIRRGPVAQILLLWPLSKSINTFLDDAFKVISKSHLVDTFAVESTLLIRRRAEDRRKLFRKQIGSDEADTILGLIPKHRIVTTRTTSIEYRDNVTGETFTVTHKEKPEPYRGQDVSNWMKLSRIILDRHPEETTRYDDTGTTGDAPNDVAGGVAPQAEDGATEGVEHAAENTGT